MQEIMILSIYFFSTLVVGIFMIYNNSLSGQLEKFIPKSNEYQMLFLLIATLLGYIFVYFLYFITKKNRIKFLNIKFEVDLNKFSLIFLIINILELIFLLKTGVGIVGSNNTHRLSFIFMFLRFDAIFNIYYVLCRQGSSKVLYILNIILFSIYKLLQGWTGFLLNIFILEMYFFIKRLDLNKNIKVAVIILFPLICIIVGGYFYTYASILKTYVRDGYILDRGYIEGTIALTNRLTFFPISVGVYDKIEMLKDLYYSEDIIFKEIKGLFRPILPGFIMTNKEFRPLNNNIMQAYYPDLSNNTSSDFGIIMYSIALFNISVLEWLLWIIITLVLIVVFKMLFNSIEQTEGELDVIYFLMLIKLYTTASLEMVFGSGYIPIFYSLIVLIIFKVFKIKKGLKV